MAHKHPPLAEELLTIDGYEKEEFLPPDNSGMHQVDGLNHIGGHRRR